MWSLSNHNANIILYAEPSINRELQRSIAFCAAVCGCLSLTFAASPPAPSEQRGWPVHDEQVLQFLAHFALFYCIPTLAQPWLTAPDGARSAKLRRNSNWVNTPKLHSTSQCAVRRRWAQGVLTWQEAESKSREARDKRQELPSSFPFAASSLISFCPFGSYVYWLNLLLIPIFV